MFLTRRNHNGWPWPFTVRSWAAPVTGHRASPIGRRSSCLVFPLDGAAQELRWPVGAWGRWQESERPPGFAGYLACRSWLQCNFVPGLLREDVDPRDL